jgi:hypothetical protein
MAEGVQVIRTSAARRLNDGREERASLAWSAVADSAVEVTIFVDSFRASGCAFAGVSLNLVGCMREVLRGEAFLVRIDFEAILEPKGASGQQCACRNNAR